MERTITYQISESEHGLRVEQYLRHKGYSYQNLTQLKKMPESILINGSGLICEVHFPAAIL